MTSKNTHLVQVAGLRKGMFVELEFGWLPHPFPIGKSKITDKKQIDTRRALGLSRVHYVPAKSVIVPAPGDCTAAVLSNISDRVAGTERCATAYKGEPLLDQRGVDLVAQQQFKLAACERLVADIVQLYRETVELAALQPKTAAAKCLTLVGALVAEMEQQGALSIGLLANASGDKSVIHLINVKILSLLLCRDLGLISADLIARGSIKSAMFPNRAMNSFTPRQRNCHFFRQVEHHFEDEAMV